MTQSESSPLAPSARQGRSAPRADGVRSRARILEAAEHLLSERGYAGTGIAAISKASGLPASSIYWHFESKEDLAAAVVERATDLWVETLEASAPGAGASSDELSDWVAQTIEENARRLPLFLRLSLLLGLELGHREPALLERLRRGRDRARRLVRATLDRQFIAEGLEVEPGLADEVASLTLAFSEGAFVARLFEPDGIDPKRLSEDLGVAMRAITQARQSGGAS